MAEGGNAAIAAAPRSEPKLTIKQEFKQRPPSDTAASCNLAKNPNENKQFEVTI